MPVYNPKTFHKFGVTPEMDVQKRFKDLEGKYDVRVLFSVILPKARAFQQEQNFLDRFPKDVYLEDKIKGITEVRVFDNTTKNGLIRELYGLKAKWAADAKKYENYEKMKFYLVEITRK